MAAVTASTSSTLADTVFQHFAASMRGDAIRPGDPSHDEVREVDNAMTDKKPALIARCSKVLLGIPSRGFGVDTRPSFRDSRRDW